jgi:hypothetical protein
MAAQLSPEVLVEPDPEEELLRLFVQEALASKSSGGSTKQYDQ